MDWIKRAAFAVTLGFCASPLLAQEKRTWDYSNGRWAEVSPATPRVIQDDPTLDQAQRYLKNNQSATARAILLQWEHTHKDSPLRDRCIFMIAQSEYVDDDWILAFYYYDEVMDEYPDSPLYHQAVENQFTIAKGYLDGHKRKFLGLPILGAEDEAVEMLFRIQGRVPGSTLAERALLLTADYYYNSGQFDLAADAYGYFAQHFPRSPQVPRVRLREAFASLAQFRGLRYDATPLIDARQQLLDIEKEYPDLATEENLPAVVDQIDDAFASKLLTIGDFYTRTGEPKAAEYNYLFLTHTYPTSNAAAIARQRLAKLPAWTKRPPNPPSAEGYAPATEPSGDTGSDEGTH